MNKVLITYKLKLPWNQTEKCMILKVIWSHNYFVIYLSKEYLPIICKLMKWVPRYERSHLTLLTFTTMIARFFPSSYSLQVMWRYMQIPHKSFSYNWVRYISHTSKDPSSNASSSSTDWKRQIWSIFPYLVQAMAWAMISAKRTWRCSSVSEHNLG